jgi:hypothetical protein
MSLSTVYTNFFGICTHMDNKDLTIWTDWGLQKLPLEDRVVLVDASTEDIIQNSRLFGLNPPVAPHIPRLQIRVEDIESITDMNTDGFVAQPVSNDVVIWKLRNVILSIANAVPGELARPAHDLPHLSQLCKNLGPPSASMTYYPIPTRAAAYFDFFSGQIECRSNGTAAAAQVTCTTVGNPQIRVRPFAQDGMPISIVLSPGSVISVYNSPEPPAEDGDNDFLLHYLNAAAFPSDPCIPGPCDCPPLFDHPNPTPERDNYPVGMPCTTTPSCSNSTFP